VEVGMLHSELQFQYDTLGDLLRARRLSLGLTQREVELRISQRGPKAISRESIGRMEGGYWIPKDADVFRSLALALEVDEDVIRYYADLTRNERRLLSNEYSHVLDLVNAMIRIMSSDEQDQTFRTLEKKIVLFDEPIYRLARNFAHLWTGRIGVDDLPGNGLRPLKHYLRPFCQEDMIPWRGEENRRNR
jgi:transcriptional regulator with XRE-family HTH domain